MVKVQNKIVLISNILISLICIIILMILWNKADIQWSKRIIFILVPLFIYHNVVLKVCKYKAFDFVRVFLYLNYLFLFGRVILNGLGLDGEIFWKLFDYYSTIGCNRAALFCLAYIQLLFTGLTMFPKNNEQTAEKKERKEKLYSQTTMNRMGKLMLITTMPFKLFYDYNLIIAQRSGQSYTATSDATNGVISNLAVLPVLGLLMMMFSKKNSKNKTLIILGLYFLYSLVVMIFAGDRRQFVISFIVILIAFLDCFDLKISIKRKITFSIIAILGLLIIEAIRIGRQEVIYSFSQFSTLLKNELLSGNIIFDVAAEFGLTFFSVAAVVDFFPSRFAFILGKEYIYSILVIVPKLAGLFPGISEYSQVTKLVKSVYGHGLGGSIPQDLYANFGVFGLMLAIIVGIILVRLTKQYKNATNSDRAFYYINYYLLLNMIRAGIPEMTRLFAYGYLMIFIYRIIFNNKIRGGTSNVRNNEKTV